MQDQFDELPNRGNAPVNPAYLALQASEYLQALDTFEKHEDRAWRAQAKSELSRVLAIALRECTVHNWDFLEVLSEGVEYERDVLKEIHEGRRSPRPRTESNIPRPRTELKE